MKPWYEKWLAEVLQQIEPIRDCKRPENEGKKGQRTPDWLMESEEGDTIAVEMTDVAVNRPTEVDSDGKRKQKEVWGNFVGPADLVDPVKKKIKDKAGHRQLGGGEDEKWLVIGLNLAAGAGWHSMELDTSPDIGNMATRQGSRVQHDGLDEIAEHASLCGIDKIFLVRMSEETTSRVLRIETAAKRSTLHRIPKGFSEWPPPEKEHDAS